MKRISVIDVAREAGVAPGSVSRALNGERHVSQALRTRVAEAAQRLGYQPNAQARGLRLGRSSTIGMLVNDMRHPMYTGVIAAVERELSQHGQMLLLADAHGELARERTVIDTFQRSALDGAIIGASFDPAALESSHYGDNRLPLVLIDRDVDGMDRVLVERRNGMRTAVRHLLSLGHRRIAMFTPALDRVPGAERMAGYSDAYRQAGLQPDPELIPTLAALQDGGGALSRLLDGPARPTALVCLGTRLLSGAMRAVRQRGLRVPEDFSIIAIGAPDMLELAHPPLTCLRMDLDAVGRSAAQLLMRRLREPSSSPGERVELETDLVVRDSCAPVPH